MSIQKKILVLMTIMALIFCPLYQATKDIKIVTESFAQPRPNSSDLKTKNLHEAQKLAQKSRSRLLDENREGIEGLWRAWYAELERYANHKLKHEHLPEFSWFSPFRDNKTANLKRIRKLSERLLVEFKNPEIEALRTRYFELKSKINDERLAARKAAEDSYQAPEEGDTYFWQNNREDYIELKERKEKAVKAYRQEQQKLLSACHEKLLQLGIELTHQQVEQLFKMSPN